MINGLPSSTTKIVATAKGFAPASEFVADVIGGPI
jgi:hypothetical protein